MLNLLEEIPTEDVFPPGNPGKLDGDEEFDEEDYEDEDE